MKKRDQEWIAWKIFAMYLLIVVIVLSLGMCN